MPKSYLPYLFVLSLLACCIEIDTSVPSFPEIAQYFKVVEGRVHLTVAINFLGFCLSSFVYGPLSESFGRRKIMLIGNAVLLIGAIGCVFAPTFNWLLVARFIQGVGASTSAVVVFAMVADIYQGIKAINLIGLMNSALTFFMAIAPVAGGFISKTVGWRGNYTTIAIICFISWILLISFLPETKKEKSNFKLERIFNDYGKLLSNSQFIYSSIVPSLLYSAYMSFIACAPFLYMETFKLSILVYAFHQATIIAVYTLTSIFSGPITQKLKKQSCIGIGMGLSITSSILLICLCLTDSCISYVITFFMSIFCIGSAICYPIIFASSLEILPEIKGIASSVIMGMRAFLIAIFAALSGYLYNGNPFRVALVVLLPTTLGSIFTARILRSFR